MPSVYLDPTSQQNVDGSAWSHTSDLASVLAKGIRAEHEPRAPAVTVRHEVEWADNGWADLIFSCAGLPSWSGTFGEATGRTQIILWAFGVVASGIASFGNYSPGTLCRVSDDAIIVEETPALVLSDVSEWQSLSLLVGDRTRADFGDAVYFRFKPDPGLSASELRAVYLDFGAAWSAGGAGAALRRWPSASKLRFRRPLRRLGA